MATQVKMKIVRGQPSKDITVAAGTTISGGDAMELNIDSDKMSKNDALAGLDKLKRRILESPWPLL